MRASFRGLKFLPLAFVFAIGALANSCAAHAPTVAVDGAGEPKTPAQVIKSLLLGTEGLQLSVTGETLVLEGVVYSVEDAQRVELILRRYPEVLNHVRSSLSHMSREQQLNRALEKAGVLTLKVRRVGESFVLEGSGDAAERQRAELIVQGVLKESVFPP